MAESLVDKLKKFYKMGLYTYVQVYDFVEKGKITEEQFREIVGENN